MEGLLLKIQWVLVHPSDFFRQRAREVHIRESALYGITLTFMSSILSSLLNLVLRGGQLNLSLLRKFFYLNLPLPGSAPVKFALLTVVYSCVLIFLSYLVAFLLKVWMHLFLVRASYTKAYQLMAYSLTPVYLLGWISEIVSFATWIWVLILLIIGSRGMFEVSRRKSWLMFTLPAIIFVMGRIAVGLWFAKIVG